MVSIGLILFVIRSAERRRRRLIAVHSFQMPRNNIVFGNEWEMTIISVIGTHLNHITNIRLVHNRLDEGIFMGIQNGWKCSGKK